MNELLLNELRARYEAGENITALLKARDGTNSAKAIEVAYDLQAGSYVDFVSNNMDDWNRYTSELGDILRRFVNPLDSMLDCGAGELTTLSGVVRSLPADIQVLAFDISLSRIRVGNAFVQRTMRSDLAPKLRSFCATMEHIPLGDGSIDVVMTAHALEPNRGREELLLAELFRVSRRHVILCEPSYEDNSPEGKERMDRLGYVRNMDEHIAKCGGVIAEKIRMDNVMNPLNPSCCWIIEVDSGPSRSETDYRCPISRARLRKREGYYWSDKGLYAYPVIEGVPILKPEYAIVLTHG